MSAPASPLPSRATTLAVVAAAHGLVLWIIWRGHSAPVDEAQTFNSVMFFFPDPARSRTARPSVRRMAPPAVRVGTRPVPVQSHPSVDSGTAITLPTGPTAGVDWDAELTHAADSTLEKEKRAREQLGALTRKFVAEPDPNNPGPVPAGRFRWYDAGIHHIDTRGSVPVLHLNGRCVLIAFIIPACAIGHIEIHDDLFEDMAAEGERQLSTARRNEVP
jgi:hypothetical protein